jgi:hypothetical protein
MRLILAALSLLAFILPAAAYDTPEALVEAIYAPYLNATPATDPVELRSEALQKLYVEEQERQAAGEGPSFDFDPLINAQDYEITEFATALGPDSNEYSAAVDVTFKNFGEPVILQLIVFNFEDGWKLEDVVSKTPGGEDLLTDLLSPKIVFGEEVFADPKKVVEALYTPYQGAYNDFNWRRWDETQLYSTGLKDLFEKDRVEANGEIGRIDFDPWINGQDYLVTALSIGDAEISDDKASVPVTFKNFDSEQNASISLALEDGRWKVDDVENFGAEYPYRLRAILEAPL